MKVVLVMPVRPSLFALRSYRMNSNMRHGLLRLILICAECALELLALLRPFVDAILHQVQGKRRCSVLSLKAEDLIELWR